MWYEKGKGFKIALKKKETSFNAPKKIFFFVCVVSNINNVHLELLRKEWQSVVA